MKTGTAWKNNFDDIKKAVTSELQEQQLIA